MVASVIRGNLLSSSQIPGHVFCPPKLQNNVLLSSQIPDTFYCPVKFQTRYIV